MFIGAGPMVAAATGEQMSNPAMMSRMLEMNIVVSEVMPIVSFSETPCVSVMDTGLKSG
jgi:hypothetical protein